MQTNRHTMKRFRAHIALTLACWLTCSAYPLASEVWPQFRGPTGQGISAATHLPVQWDAKSNVVWKIPLPGKGWSSPVVADGRVYLTTALEMKEDPPVSLRVQCVDA